MRIRAHSLVFGVIALASITLASSQGQAASDCEPGCLVTAQAAPAKEPRDAKTDSLSPSGLPQGLKTDRGGASTKPDSGSVLASRLIGQEAVGPTGEALGRVSDIALSPALETEAAIIALTGSLGLRTREVMIPASALSLESTDEGMSRLRIAWSREQIAAAPVFERSALMR